MFTVHNLADQGDFLRPDALVVPDGAGFYGQRSCLTAGTRCADRLTTLSPIHAWALLAPAFGAGQDGLLRARAGARVGILNGLDTELRNPAAEAALPARRDQGAQVALRGEGDPGQQAAFRAAVIGHGSRLAVQPRARMIVLPAAADPPRSDRLAHPERVLAEAAG